MPKIGLLSFSAGLIAIFLLSAFLGRPGPSPQRPQVSHSGPRVPAPWILAPRPPTPYPLVYPAYFGNRINTTDDNPLTNEGVALGRMLFYEKRLSANNTIACGTCHRQQLAFTDGRVFSQGFDATPTKRNSMSLVNLLWVRHFFWDGRAASLEDQAITPLTDPHEMGQSLDSSAAKLRSQPVYPRLFADAFGADSITPGRIIKALTQFERTLISANAPYDKYLRGEYQPTPPERSGIDLFFTNPNPAKGIRGAGCGSCHDGPKVANEMYHNNGLDSIPKDPGREGVTGLRYDRGRFRVVTLRNIAITAPYMHDGRFTTLEEVIDHYSEHIRHSATLSPSLTNVSNDLAEAGSRPGSPDEIRPGPSITTGIRLTPAEKADILAFLHMLTDSSFIMDPRFSDPFTATSLSSSHQHP